MPDLANGAYVSQSDALRRWVPAARAVLIETAGAYGAWITEEELGRRVQAATGITTKQAAHEWVGRVLARVATDALARDEPRLASLCVRSDLSVVDHAGSAPGASMRERERRAAQDRLDCYRAFGATLPADGGQPQPMPRSSARPAESRRRTSERAASRRPARIAPAVPRPEVTCTSCFMLVPVAATCRDCGAPLPD